MPSYYCNIDEMKGRTELSTNDPMAAIRQYIDGLKNPSGTPLNFLGLTPAGRADLEVEPPRRGPRRGLFQQGDQVMNEVDLRRKMIDDLAELAASLIRKGRSVSRSEVRGR